MFKLNFMIIKQKIHMRFEGAVRVLIWARRRWLWIICYIIKTNSIQTLNLKVDASNLQHFFHHSRTLKIWKLLWKYHLWLENYNSNNKRRPQGMKLTKGANQLWKPQMLQQEAEKCMIRKWVKRTKQDFKHVILIPEE